MTDFLVRFIKKKSGIFEENAVIKQDFYENLAKNFMQDDINFLHQELADIQVEEIIEMSLEEGMLDGLASGSGLGEPEELFLKPYQREDFKRSQRGQ